MPFSYGEGPFFDTVPKLEEIVTCIWMSSHFWSTRISKLMITWSNSIFCPCSKFKLFEYPLLVRRLLFELDQKRVSGQFKDGPKGRFDHVIINFYEKFGWVKNKTVCRRDLPRYLNWTKNLTAGNIVSYHLLLPTLTGWFQFQPCIRQFLFSRIEKRIVVTDIYIVSENLKMSI